MRISDWSSDVCSSDLGRTELFDFIRDEGIGGVVCISGDSHMDELNCIPRSQQGGYDIYDFCSSPLAQMPAAKNTRQAPEVRVRDTWTRSVNVGLMRFDMTGDKIGRASCRERGCQYG